jgi:hypothetical protein
MSSDRVIIDAIKMAQRLLWQNLAPTPKLPDATTVMRSGDLVHSPAIQSALERSSDTRFLLTGECEPLSAGRRVRIYARRWPYVCIYPEDTIAPCKWTHEKVLSK